MISERLDSKDKLTLRIALRHLDVDLPALEEAIRQLMDNRYEYLSANVAEGIMWPLAIEFVTLDALEVSPVTGKSLRVIERRFKDI